MFCFNDFLTGHYPTSLPPVLKYIRKSLFILFRFAKFGICYLRSCYVHWLPLVLTPGNTWNNAWHTSAPGKDYISSRSATLKLQDPYYCLNLLFALSAGLYRDLEGLWSNHHIPLTLLKEVNSILSWKFILCWGRQFFLPLYLYAKSMEFPEHEWVVRMLIANPELLCPPVPQHNTYQL